MSSLSERLLPTPDPRCALVHGRWSVVRDYCAGRRVLDVGCVGDYRTLQDLKQSQFVRLAAVCDVVGVDLNEAGVGYLRSLGLTCVSGNAAELHRLDVGDFDVIHMGDIIEHLPNPGQALMNARDLLRPHGFLVVSVPNAMHWLNPVAMLPPRTAEQRLLWTSRGQHTAWYCRVTLRNLARFAGFDEVKTYLATYWPDLGPRVGRSVAASSRYAVEKLLFKLNPELAPHLVGVYAKRDSFGDEDVQRVYAERWHTQAIRDEAKTAGDVGAAGLR
jgi:2-polyprenyl-3-methyl-5-hydroxy-6-metoxy-1,4-benzoquinol methylase